MPSFSPSLATRLFLTYLALIALGGWFVAREVLEEVKPAVRQSTEETLVDTANLLAEVVKSDVKNGTLSAAKWPEVLNNYGRRRPHAEIWGIEKETVNHRIYVVDAAGKVLLDSTGKDIGADYSRWRDVYLTLRGKYGARSTRSNPNDERSTIMYVAAPILDNGKIIGAVTVAKPNHTVEPYIERARSRLLWLGLAFVAVGSVAGALLAFFLGRIVQRLTNYADQVSRGERATVPELPAGELANLARALEQMRGELDGKSYVEQYVQTLTHELKSPLSAIRGAAELLRGDIPAEKRARFLTNIETETARLHSLSERMLALALVEKRRTLEDVSTFSASELISDLLVRCQQRIELQALTIRIRVDESLRISGERFLLAQALLNLLDNAIDFTPTSGAIEVEVTNDGDQTAFRIHNEGPEIPDYALSRLTERFYSLARPATGRKSSGLGLSFVQEVAELHGGTFSIANVTDGVVALLKVARGDREK